jgi:hypothetical protein
VLRVDSVGEVAEDSEPDHKREERHLNPRGGDESGDRWGPGIRCGGPILRGRNAHQGLRSRSAHGMWRLVPERASAHQPAAERGNPVLAPQTVVSPHTLDEGPQLGVYRRPAVPAAGAPTPPKPSCRPMPPENRRGSHDHHGLEKGARSRCQRRDQPSVQSA